jgi:hypothetical protein
MSRTISQICRSRLDGTANANRDSDSRERREQIQSFHGSSEETVQRGAVSDQSVDGHSASDSTYRLCSRASGSKSSTTGSGSEATRGKTKARMRDDTLARARAETTGPTVAYVHLMGLSISGRARRMVNGTRARLLPQQFGARPEPIGMTLVLASLLLVTSTDAPATSSQSGAARHPFAWFAPALSIPDDALERMDRREVVSWMLPADGDELALFVGSTIRTDARSFVGEIGRNERVWSGKHVRHVRRFSTPPQIENVANLALESGDLNALRRCKPGDCDIKLSEPEIARVRAAIAGAPTSWQAAAQDEFRRIVLDRAATYLAQGHRGFQPYVDKSASLDPQRAFEDVIRQMPLVTRRLPFLVSYFDEYPKASRPQIQSFLFWMETTYTPKPTIQVIHAVTLRPAQSDSSAPEVIVAWRQIYATHYINALVSISALVRDDRDPSRRFLVYVNRSKLDALGGWLRGVKRHFVESRVRDSAEALFEAQRQQIEGSPATSGAEAGVIPPIQPRNGRPPRP